MEDLLLDILARLRARPDLPALPPEELERLVRHHNAGRAAGDQRLSKRGVLPFYLRVKQEEPKRWRGWGIDGALEARLVASVRLKPRRTASGVTTITVITVPHPCSGSCAFCPSDVRMPKSYLASEPACRRAEQQFFDPYLQVSSRLQALSAMGHATDKVELIVLGGTWTDYGRTYRLWFVRELFRALNEWGTPAAQASADERVALYQGLGLTNDADELARRTAAEQARVRTGEETYNEAVARLYGGSAAHRQAASRMRATMAEVTAEQTCNEGARSRCVGLVVETRPDAVTPETLTFARQLGCTKIQLGIQSTRQDVLDRNDRGASVIQARRAIALVRLYGFKIHVHLMANLVGATPEQDKADYRTLVGDPDLMPDEVKLYPCALVAGTRLERLWRAGAWEPYTTDQLMDLLVADTLATPAFVRISRMVRDIGAQDIVAGNKHANLRQMVDARIEREGLAGRVRDIRSREIAGAAVDLGSLRLVDVPYETSVTRERFLQWITPEGHIVGFCRLSLPRWDELRAVGQDAGGPAVPVRAGELPTRPGDAMIREVHVYGREAHLGASDSSSQHRGLGRTLVERACAIAREEGYARVHVISAVGTRAYYRRLGFGDAPDTGGLYQTRRL